MTLRELNRATLARQMLLAREKRPVLKAIEQLLGLQAQLPRPPFTGLWSRLQGFARADLAGAVNKRTVVRGTSMRGTIHLMTAADFLKFRACLQPSLDAGMRAILKERADSLDLPALLAVARAYLGQPHNFEQARDHLVAKFPRGDERAMGYAARMGVPLVQVPSTDAWAFDAQAAFVNAETWLKKPVADCSRTGPARAAVPAGLWPGHREGRAGVDSACGTSTGLCQPWLEARDAARSVGKPRYDLPDAPRPDADTPAPVRFIPEWDSVIVTRADERVVAKADRPRVFLPGLRIAALVLVDGLAAASWKVSATSKKATLQIESFKAWPAAVRREVAAEGEALLRFVEPDVATYDMKVTTA